MNVPRARRRRGGLEEEVEAVLRAADGALTPTEVLAALASDLAYTTVLTALVRLHGKGVLSRERRGRAYAYRPVDPAARTAAGMRRLLDADPAGRSAALAHFVDDLDGDDVPRLRALLEQAEDAD